MAPEEITDQSSILQHLESHNSAFIDFARWVLDLCGVDKAPDFVAILAMIVMATLSSVVIYWVVKELVVVGISHIVKRTENDWDDHLLNKDVLTKLTYVAPIISLISFGKAMEIEHTLIGLYNKAVYIYATICVGRLGISLTHAIFNLLSIKFPKMQSLKGIQQLIIYVIFTLIAIVIVSIIINRSPGTLLAGLGASAALMSLVFKETIQSLVSGIQLTANDMLAPGDWIVVPKAGANGTVVEMNLNTVKIRNWDNTITTVPPSTLMQDSFTNWRGMQESEGRRFARSISIDMDTVRFLSADEEAKFAAMPEVANLMAAKAQQGEQTEPITNLTLFREYTYNYLAHKENIANHGAGTNIRIMVRYLQPTQYGLPMEIYCFTRTKVWEQYENETADITDHVIASMRIFGLRPYQVTSSGTEPTIK